MLDIIVAIVQKILILGAAGALGTLARVGLSSLAQRVLGERFGWGALLVNVMGCLLFGLVWAAAEGRVRPAAEIRWLVLGGFMGAFTTFSTYAFDVVAGMQQARWGLAFATLALHNVLGLAAMIGGLALGRAS